MKLSAPLLFAVVAALLGAPLAGARTLRLPVTQQLLPPQEAPAFARLGEAGAGPAWGVGVGLSICAAAGAVGLAVSGILLCCLYDAAAQWRHRANFRACRRKVQRVHRVLLSSSGELPLCPCCVESISSKASRSAVVFLCGHRFHVDCANRWLREQEGKDGSNTCPLCASCAAVGSSSDSEGADPVHGAVVEPEEGGQVVRGQPDEAKTFILRSLSKQYPEIITEACVQRWCHCHTELWMSELSCPRYVSVFRTKQMP